MAPANNRGSSHVLPPILPIDAFIPQVLELLTQNSSLILRAEPGAGKTTRVPPALLSLPEIARTNQEVWVLEPRRLAAKLSAERVAQEWGEECGERVGYHFRFERKTGPKTRLLFLTEGMLLRRVASNPTLKGVGAVVLDEFHERSIHTDVALALVAQLQKTVRPDLKLIIMSATLDGEALSTFLAGNRSATPGAQKVARLDCPGRMFAVTTDYLSHEEVKQAPYLEHRVKRAAQKLLELKKSQPTAAQPDHPGASGDVLVFLPGMGEILRAKEQLLSLPEFDLAILHGDLSREEQSHAIQKGESLTGRRKIILSTNIAETSVTLPGITTVIDGGLHKQGGYAHWSGMNKLDTRSISKASAIQRGGRAGRVREGYCLRLYTKGDYDGFAPFDVPEILRTDLAPLVIELVSLGLFEQLSFFEPPPPEKIQTALTLLQSLGALLPQTQVAPDSIADPSIAPGPASWPAYGPKLTELGKKMSGLGLHPRAARIFFKAQELGLNDWAPWIAAWVSEGRRGLESTLEVERELLNFRKMPGFTAKKVVERLQSHSLAQTSAHTNPLTDVLGQVLLAGFPDRVAKISRIKSDGADVLLSQGGSALLPDLALAQSSSYFVVCDATERRGTTVLKSVCPISEEELWALEPSQLQEKTEYTVTPDSRRVVLATRLSVGQITVDEQQIERLGGQPGPRLDAAVQALTDWILGQGPSLTKEFALEAEWNEITARTAFVKKLRPEFDAPNLPTLLKKCAQECFTLASAGGIISLPAFQNYWRETGGLHANFKAALSTQDTEALDHLAPDHLVLPSKNRDGKNKRAQVHYEQDRGPWVESRLQDFFGLNHAPSVGGGAVKLTLQLLAPNYRAVQVTQDLPSFWKNTYPQVRKELMRRYPRHKWPEDPYSLFVEGQ